MSSIQRHAAPHRMIHLTAKASAHPIASDNEASVRFSGDATPKSSWRKTLGIGLLGVLGLLPAGCTSNAEKMEQAYKEIPFVQVEKRFDFLKQQLANPDNAVHTQALEHIGTLGIKTGEKVELLMKELNSSDNGIAQAAEKALTEGVVANVEAPREVKKPVATAIETRPWVENKQVYTHTTHTPMWIGKTMIMMPHRHYRTETINHGDKAQYQEACQQVQQWLQQH